MMTECYDYIHHKRVSILLFLDIKKAFDSICHKKLLKKLNFYGIRGVANTLMSSNLHILETENNLFILTMNFLLPKVLI